MPQKKQVSIAEIKVGVLVLVVLALLAFFIIQSNWGFDWFGETDTILTYLPDVGGLKPGAPVWLAGIEIGKVNRVSIVSPEVYAGNEPVFRKISAIKDQIDNLDMKEPTYKKVHADLQDQIRNLKVELRFVEVQMDIKRPHLNRLSLDSEVTIDSKGLIGDSYIAISAGTYGVPPRKEGEFYIIEGARVAGFREIITGANDVIANFGVLSDEFKNIALKINPEKVGSDLAETIQELQSTLRQANNTFAEATKLVNDLRQGKGTFGRMAADPKLYDRLVAAIENFNRLADQIQTGSGTMAKLITNPELFDNVTSTLKKTDIMMDRIAKGEGTLGMLSKDPALYDNSRQAMEKVASFIDQIDRGEGTMGKLLKDPTLYNNLNQSTAEITKLIYDLRKDPKKYLTIRFRLF